MAEIYCHQGEYESAEETYVLLAERYPEEYKERADRHIRKIHEGLARLPFLRETPKEGETDHERLHRLRKLAMVYEFDLLNDPMAHQAYLKIRDLVDTWEERLKFEKSIWELEQRMRM